MPGGPVAQDARLQEAVRLYQGGQYPAAESTLLSWVGNLPAPPAEASHLLGLVASKRGDSAAAIAWMEKAVAAAPGNADYAAHFTEILRAAGQIQRAVAAGREAVRLSAFSPTALNNLGIALMDSKAPEEAEGCFRQAIQIKPDYARAHYNLGNALQEQERYAAAETSYREALRLRSDYPQALNGLGVCAMQLDRLPDALQCFQRAIELDADNPKSYFNMALAYYREQQYDPARLLLEKAVALKPDYFQAHVQIGHCHIAVTDYGKALDAFRKASSLRSNVEEVEVNLIRCRMEVCDWSQWDEDIAAAQRIITEAVAQDKRSPVSPWVAANMPLPPVLHYAIAVQEAKHFDKHVKALHPPVFSFPTGRAADGRLRIGYISGELRNNAAGHLTRSMFGLHDRSRFEIFAYSIGVDDGSIYRRDIEAGCDHFRDLLEARAVEAAERINQDGIHVLIDLTGYACAYRPEILAMRPVPVQVGLLYPGSLGGIFSDYFVGDPVFTPPEEEHRFPEKLIVMPGSYQVNDRDQPVDMTSFPTRASCGLPDDRFIFCCFNRHGKIDPGIFRTWMRILKRAPGSVLWLIAHSEITVRNLQEQAAADGINPSRLLFGPPYDKAKHLGRVRHSDLMLDTRYYTGHTTASDSLWAGVPVLTCPGEYLVSRVGASLVTAAGLPELICSSLEDYEEKAVRLATDRNEYGNLRRRLEETRTTCPLFDTARTVANLEKAYEIIWSRHEQGLPPETLRL